MGFTLPADNEYMKNGAKAIRDNAQAAADNIEKTRYKRGTIAANSDLNDYYGAGVDGVYACLSGSIAATLKNLPPDPAPMSATTTATAAPAALVGTIERMGTAGRPAANRTYNVKVEFHGVTTDRIGVAREIRKLLRDEEALMGAG